MAPSTVPEGAGSRLQSLIYHKLKCSYGLDLPVTVP